VGSRIERDLSAVKGGEIPAEFRYKRVRRLVTGRGEKENGVPDETQCEYFRRQLHVAAIVACRLSLVDHPARKAHQKVLKALQVL